MNLLTYKQKNPLFSGEFYYLRLANQYNSFPFSQALYMIASEKLFAQEAA